MNSKIRNALIAALLFAVFGCASSRYPNWEYVRIEQAIPSKDCDYKVQQVCEGPGCYNWHKKTATKYGANTVVMIIQDRTQTTSGSVVAIGSSAGGSISSTPTQTTVADYYSCPVRRKSAT
jgi:hypothetical protein